MGNKIRKPPATAEEFRTLLLKDYDGLSKRLKQVARYVLDEPNELALETLAVIAERCGVQPSAIVRFAQAFGFSGASQMQRLFRDGLLSANNAIGYGERVRRFSESVSRTAAGEGLLTEFVEGNILALQNLSETVSEKEMRGAVDLIANAAVVHVAGFRRAFPISAYLAYSLQQLGKHVQFIDGVGGLARPQANTIDDRDLLIAVSFHPYAPETVELTEIATRNGAKILSISDSRVSPIAKAADIALQVHDSEVRSFRSLAASMCLAQAVVIGFAFEAEGSRKVARKK
ncbi:MurR/RpiR family transcriptional regulator [Sphingomonas sp. NSE70-1]|uniref:MurR/RpiR family transcriptional regulator n=1 Tax=Sphingomonas caseinilyticus TaxID=2908205 RepID=A0ABT0RWZ7_9SPHN|nr:MurR/RpiR family transcriptional regulator [Sphingomonas caseinilyticus]MCL6699520.1 MurR/RpiR family transcriptional regulator [Sphingomonas caseinilyticus]